MLILHETFQRGVINEEGEQHRQTLVRLLLQGDEELKVKRIRPPVSGRERGGNVADCIICIFRNSGFCLWLGAAEREAMKLEQVTKKNQACWLERFPFLINNKGNKKMYSKNFICMFKTKKKKPCINWLPGDRKGTGGNRSAKSNCRDTERHLGDHRVNCSGMQTLTWVLVLRTRLWFLNTCNM